MKNYYKILFIFLVFLLSFNMKIKADKLNLQIYPIKDKLIIKNYLEFYDNNNKSLIKVVVNENHKNLDNEIEEDNNIDDVYETNQIVEDNNIDEVYETNQIVENENNVIPDSKYISVSEYAQQFIGNPYVYGGTSLTEGADCSGFVMKIYEQFGVKLPRTARDQATVGNGVSIENAQPGDIVSYGYNGIVSHSAIYIGNERIVHAATPKDGITTASVYMMPIITIRRIG